MNVIPYGYKMNKGQIVIQSTSASVIRTVFSKKLELTSNRAIARYLNEHELFKPSGTNWYHHDIGKILKNQRYCGEYGYPKIVSRKVFEEVQKLGIQKIKYHSSNEFPLVIDVYSGQQMRLYGQMWKIPKVQHHEYFDKSATISNEVLIDTLVSLLTSIKFFPAKLIQKAEEVKMSSRVREYDQVLEIIRGQEEDRYVISESMKKAQVMYDELAQKTIRIDLNKTIFSIISDDHPMIDLITRIISKVAVWDEELQVTLISNQLLKISYIQKGKKNNGKQKNRY